MIKEITMPNLGTTVDEIKVVRWLKEVGDKIERGEVLFEVETDKAIMDVESYLSGYLKKIVVEAEEATTTGDVVAFIGDEDDVFEKKTEDVEAKDIEQAPKVIKKTQNIRISPMVKKIAEKLGVDYTTIHGTGPNGLITKHDVEAAAQDEKEADDNVSGNIRVFNKIGKATARAMTLSKTTIPHVYYQVEVDASALMARRDQLEKAVSYNALLIDAVAGSLQEFPYLASRYSEEGRILSERFNIGLAVAQDDDLLVPVISDTGNKDVFEIEKDISVLVEKVKNNHLSQQDISGGVFTITNLGGVGIDAFSAVINPPEAGILAIGRIVDKAVVVDGDICIRPIMCLTLSADHRIVNGVYAANFLATLKKKIERTYIDE